MTDLLNKLLACGMTLTEGPDGSVQMTFPPAALLAGTVQLTPAGQGTVSATLDTTGSIVFSVVPSEWVLICEFADRTPEVDVILQATGVKFKTLVSITGNKVNAAKAAEGDVRAFMRAMATTMGLA